MMMKIVKYTLFLMLLFFSISEAKSQQIGVKRQNRNIQQLIKIWGLVKYKSAKSAIGNFDADQVFLSLIDSVKNADQKQFNQLMVTLVGDLEPLLGTVENNYDSVNRNAYRYLRKNVDYGWINSDSYLRELKTRLLALSNQVNLTGKHHYVPAVWYEGNLTNEQTYQNYNFDSEPMNLLCLAKIWNAVAYLFPYKYMMDKDWQKILPEIIPVFRNISDRTAYEKAILMLSVDLNDTHAAAFMSPENMKMAHAIFNVRYYPPFDYVARKKEIIVTKFLNDSLANHSPLKTGDEIIAINGVAISKWLNERAKLIPASNEAVKYNALSTVNNNRGDTFAFSNLPSGTLNLKVKRGKTYLNIELVMLDRQNKQHIKLIETDIVEKRSKEKSIKGKENIGEDITLIRAGHFFEKDLPKKEDLLKLSAELKSKKAIIFDMRKYPQAPGLFNYYVPMLLGKAPFVFASYYAADIKSLGLYVHRAGVENYMYIPEGSAPHIGNLYDGKIVILTNADTQSMGEWFTMMLSQLNANTTIIGSQTAGADGDLRKLSLPGGYIFSFTGNGIFYPDGRETQRIGIVPDIRFKPSIKELISSEDAQLNRAISYIRQGK